MKRITYVLLFLFALCASISFGQVTATQNFDFTSLSGGVDGQDTVTQNVVTGGGLITNFRARITSNDWSYNPHILRIVAPDGTVYNLGPAFDASVIPGPQFDSGVISETGGNWRIDMFEIGSATGTLCRVEFEYTYIDNPPTAVCTNFIAQLDAAGNVTITPANVDGGSTDAEGPVTLTLSQTAFTCADIGDNTVTLTVTDGAGQTDTCTATVTVVDTVPPVWTNPGATIPAFLDATGSITLNAGNGADPFITATDNCDPTIGVRILGNAAARTFTCADIGTNPTVSVRLRDNTPGVPGNNNDTVIIVGVDLQDIMNPTITCPADITQANDAGLCSAVVTFTPIAADNCAGVTVSSVPASGSVFPVGTTLVTSTATDASGNTATCTFNVTVNDTEPPVAACMNFDAFLDASGSVTITAADVDGGSTDNCGIASLAIDIDTFTCDTDLGPNDVTLTVTDVNGNVSTCVAVVTVIDDIDPTIACPADQTANTDPGLCSAVVVFPDAIALDNCTVTVAQTGGLASGSAFPVGVSTIEYTATDSSGNTAVCTFTITVTDNELPVVVCQDITIQLDANGDASITAADIDGGSTDNCGIASIDASQTDFDCSDVGPNDITLTVTDVNGNVSTCIAVVTVEDNVDPVAVCMSITVELDVNGTVTITPADIDAGSSDACGIASLELDVDTFTCAEVGENTVTLTVTDNNGNVSTCTAIVTVEDNIDPDLVCMDITVELDENGEAEIVPEDVMANNTDACGIMNTGIDIFQFNCDDIGTPVTVTVFSQDNNGNLSSCTAVVTVIDALAPVVTCPADVTVDPGVGNQFYEVPDYFALGEASATDNCTDPLTIFSQDPAPGTFLPDGVYTITMSAEDEYGNIGTCEFELTVESILGVDDNGIDISTIVMYPNPAINVVNISNPQNIELEQAAIYDVTGRLVQTYDLKDMGTEKTLDISMLSTATYVVLIQGPEGQVTKQLIKE